MREGTQPGLRVPRRKGRRSWGDELAPSSVRHGSEQSIGTDRKVYRRYGKPKGRTDNRRLKGQTQGCSGPPRFFPLPMVELQGRSVTDLRDLQACGRMA